MCYYYDSTIVNIEARNTQLVDNNYKDDLVESIPFEEYCLRIKCSIKDTLLYAKKLTAYLPDFSFINIGYCAYDPGMANIFALRDSLKTINIHSLFDFDDLLKKDSNLITYFKIGYSSLRTWDASNSIAGIRPLEKIEHINRLLSVKDRYCEDWYLYFVPINKPKYEKQRFVVNFEFYSGIILSDTTEIINIK
jgi:hypothetical protein